MAGSTSPLNQRRLRYHTGYRMAEPGTIVFISPPKSGVTFIAYTGKTYHGKIFYSLYAFRGNSKEPFFDESFDDPRSRDLAFEKIISEVSGRDPRTKALDLEITKIFTEMLYRLGTQIKVGKIKIKGRDLGHYITVADAIRDLDLDPAQSKKLRRDLLTGFDRLAQWGSSEIGRRNAGPYGTWKGSGKLAEKLGISPLDLSMEAAQRYRQLSKQEATALMNTAIREYAKLSNY